MKVKPNIGILNALLRITIGLTILSWSTAKLVKKPWCNSYLFYALMGAMKVAEGIVRYCPITDYIQSQQNQPLQLQEPQQKESSFRAPIIPTP
jgi:hypothetical protein